MGTVSGGQFDWGGRLLKSNGGALDGRLAGEFLVVDELHDRLGDGGGLALADDHGRRAGEHGVHVVGPALLLRDLREVGVLDDEQAAVHLAEVGAKLRELGDAGPAVVDDEAVVGVLYLKPVSTLIVSTP